MYLYLFVIFTLGLKDRNLLTLVIVSKLARSLKVKVEKKLL